MVAHGEHSKWAHLCARGGAQTQPGFSDRPVAGLAANQTTPSSSSTLNGVATGSNTFWRAHSSKTHRPTTTRGACSCEPQTYVFLLGVAAAAASVEGAASHPNWCTSLGPQLRFRLGKKVFLCAFFCRIGTVRTAYSRSLCTCNLPKVSTFHTGWLFTTQFLTV